MTILTTFPWTATRAPNDTIKSRKDTCPGYFNRPRPNATLHIRPKTARVGALQTTHRALQNTANR